MYDNCDGALDTKRCNNDFCWDTFCFFCGIYQLTCSPTTIPALCLLAASSIQVDDLKQKYNQSLAVFILIPSHVQHYVVAPQDTKNLRDTS